MGLRRSRRVIPCSCAAHVSLVHAPLRTSSLPQHKNTSAIVVAPRFEVYIGKQEDREDDADGVPAGKDQAVKDLVGPMHQVVFASTHVNALCIIVSLP